MTEVDEVIGSSCHTAEKKRLCCHDGCWEAVRESEVVPVQCSSNMLDWYLNLVDLHLIFINHQ